MLFSPLYTSSPPLLRRFNDNLSSVEEVFQQSLLQEEKPGLAIVAHNFSSRKTILFTAPRPSSPKKKEVAAVIVASPSPKNADLTGQQFGFCDLQKPPQPLCPLSQQPPPKIEKAIIVASPVWLPAHHRRKR
ncbi:hypothetical protein MRB53_030116 [Persea americana]|uniref:Uncharacterized protein n=1 Tax=Persea americana TaxID=3435 RepID=A0ACC2KLD3_PERAE|nr:hypothetical protein MRB53_030116 [Persea americana]